MSKQLHLLVTLVLVLHSFNGAARERWLFLGDSITQAGHYTDYIETWLLLNEPEAPEIINLGLNSETISGLSEPDHPFPRPCVHTRLKRVLDRIRPDLVIACYGMNCGIYHPFSEERFKAYQDGINRLVADSKAIGAEVILLTPPPYAGRVKPRTPPDDDHSFGYRTPANDYNEVLETYATWILSLDGKDGIRAINIRPAIERFMVDCYPEEPVHPNTCGHELMGEAFLQALGKDTRSELLETGVGSHTNDPEWNKLIALVRQQRLTYDRALLNDIGHGNPSVMQMDAAPLTEALQNAEAVDTAIEELLRARPAPAALPASGKVQDHAP